MSSRSTFGTIKRIVAILLAIAIVLAAGVIVGQAPAIFGVEDDREASVTFADQHGDGSNITVESATLSDGGFVVVSDANRETVAVSPYLEAGSHENVTVEREDDGGELLGELTATVHRDTTDDERYGYDDTDGEEDQPYLENGFPVGDTAVVTPAEETDTLGESFTVESVDVPATATTNATIPVSAEIHNPTELQAQQSIDIRLDGTLIERQTVDLEPGGTAEVTAEVSTRGVEPGERTVGVYTDGDGRLESVELSFHTDPAVEAVDANATAATFDVAIPAEGFVAVEDETGTILGTSEQLGPGEYANATVDLGETVASDDDLRASLHEGDPDDRQNATPVEHEGDPVETTFQLEDVRDGGETDDLDDAVNVTGDEESNFTDDEESTLTDDEESTLTDGG